MLDLRTYLYNDRLTTSSLAFRFIGENLWGKYPLHESAFLGGQKNLRGFSRERFSGDALIFGGLELRSYLFPIRIIFPAQFGFTAFAETGRVFYEGEKSTMWHPSYGGGLWISFLNRLFIAHLTGAISREDVQIYITTGFMF
jgi:hemolysin activation/secretion protein